MSRERREALMLEVSDSTYCMSPADQLDFLQSIRAEIEGMIEALEIEMEDDAADADPFVE